MGNNKLNKAKQLARNAGYDDIIYVGKWNDKDVYAPIKKTDKPIIVGLPAYILVKGDSAKWSSEEEGFEILELLDKD